MWEKAAEQSAPRDLRSTSRTVALLYGIAAVILVLDYTIVPGRSNPWTWVPWTCVAVVVIVATTVLLIPYRLPSLSWVMIAGVVPAVMVAVLAIGAGDASAAGQLAFSWPVLMSSYQMKSGGAWFVTGIVCLADLAVNVVVQPDLYVEDAVVVPTVFIAITIIMLRNRRSIDQLLTSLRYEAEHDALTGLHSRRTFDADLDAAVAQEASVSLLFVDIDDFKLVNDNYGHFVGDELLKAVASELESNQRPHDTAYRLGGDELAVLLIGCPLGPALERAERIRRAAEAGLAARVLDLRTETVFTLSIGVACGEGPRLDKVGLLRAADKALYLAKSEGRNRVRAADEVAPLNVSS